jgi:hypothetical protein
MSLPMKSENVFGLLCLFADWLMSVSMAIADKLCVTAMSAISRIIQINILVINNSFELYIVLHSK